MLFFFYTINIIIFFHILCSALLFIYIVYGLVLFGAASSSARPFRHYQLVGTVLTRTVRSQFVKNLFLILLSPKTRIRTRLLYKKYAETVYSIYFIIVVKFSINIS